MRRNQDRLSRYLLPSIASLLAAATIGTAHGAPTVTLYAPGTETAAISGMTIENFEDLSLVPGWTVTFSTWRNSSNVITADGPVTYNGSLPVLYTPSTDGLPLNAWDGTHALVNGWGHDWASPFAAMVELQFSPAAPAVGIGLGNFQRDAASQFTFHTLFVNGVDRGKLESMPGWAGGVNVKNAYLVFNGEPITSIGFRADTHYDGLVFDKLAIGDSTTPATSQSWGRLKSLYR